MPATDVTGVDGVVPLAIGTPFLVGPINVWLIEDEPLTLVDVGPNTGTALVQLRDELAARGHRLEDVGRLVVTHQHLDHAGLVGPLVALTGAEVVAVTGMDRHLARGQAAAVAEERWNRDLMRDYGVPAEIVRGWWSARPDATGYASSAADVRTVGDGDVLEFAGRTLQVHQRPGHSPSDLVLEDRSCGVLFAGDHLLAGHPPVPLLHQALSDDAPGGVPDPAAWPVGRDGAVRVSALLTMRASLHRTATLDATTALTGHGAIVEDVGANVAARLVDQDRAAQAMHDELRHGGPGTPHELVSRTLGRAHPYFGLCTTLGTLDQLVDEHAASVAPGDGPPRYEAR